MTEARKWVAVDFGGPEVLRSIDVDVPGPGRGEVTIDVRAAGMNPADAKHIAPGQDRKLLPLPIGYEVAGVVTAIWRDTRRVRPGPARPGASRRPGGHRGRARHRRQRRGRRRVAGARR